MLYKSLYTLLQTTATSLPFDVEFNHGSGSDINIFSDQNKSVLIWLSPLRKNFTFPNQANRMFSNWTVELAFYMKDQKDASNEQSLAILETSDKITTKYLIDLQDSVASLDNIVDDISISGSQESFIKRTSHVLTGHLVTFNINLPDDFEYCP